MEKVWCVFFVFLIYKTVIFAQEEGEECELEEADGVLGKCQPSYKCSYADRMINKEIKQPTVCFISSSGITFVCCPNTPYQTGILGRTFYDSINGRLTYGDIDCRYTGQFPLVCCKRKPITASTRFNIRLGEDCDRKSNKKTAEACKACYAYQKPRRSNIVCPEESGNRIAGGEPAAIEQFPHMVVLGTRVEQKADSTSPDIVWIGAGTLITETFVLTAAHVVYSPNGKIQYALLGTSNKKDIRSGILRYIVQWLPHKMYTVRSHYHDIALVELDFRVPLSKFIRPACLPVEGIVPDIIPSQMTVAGWGRTGQYADATQQLMQGDVQIQSTKVCRKDLHVSFQSWDPNIMFCAKAKTADTCNGDSGGPLMAPLKENSMLCGYYVLGIVSYGTVCGVNFSGAYTKVRNQGYLEWITNTIWPQPSVLKNKQL